MVQNELKDYLFGLDPGRRGRMRKAKKPTAVIVLKEQRWLVVGTKAMKVCTGNSTASC